MVRGWKFWIEIVEHLYYPCSENKGADQFRSKREADMCLCFRICRLLVFPCGGSFVYAHREPFWHNATSLSKLNTNDLDSVKNLVHVSVKGCFHFGLVTHMYC